MASKWWPFLVKYVWPPSVFAGVLALLRKWHRGDVKTKAILAVFFIQAILCVGGLAFRVAYFILFHLPSFILSILGWLLLISLFSGAGLFCYEKISGKREPASDAYDASPGEADGKTEKDKKNKKNWFDDMKWFKK